MADTFKTTAAHILINRDGPALCPGPRRYTRSWIRDGAIMGAALLRIGHPGAIRDFMRWYAGFQGDDGNIPDSTGREFVAALARAVEEEEGPVTLVLFLAMTGGGVGCHPTEGGHQDQDAEKMHELVRHIGHGSSPGLPEVSDQKGAFSGRSALFAIVATRRLG